MSDFSLVIIGAGPQGISLYINLPKKVQERTAIIDSNKNPLEYFYSQAQRIDMKYLRSPISHCLKEPLVSLFSYAKKEHISKDNFNGRYLTPSLAIFKQYVQYLLGKTNIDKNYIQTTMHSLQYANGVWNINTTKGNISTKNCILALGMGTIQLPETIILSSDDTTLSAIDLQKIVQKKHILYSEFNESSIKKYQPQSIAVIGGGMSGTQVALKYCNTTSHPCNITLISGKNNSTHFFDSDPGYIGPKYRTHFLAEKDYLKRRNILTQARNPGSLNPYIKNMLTQALHNNALKIIREYVTEIKLLTTTSNSSLSHNKFSITYTNNNTQYFDDIILATGFTKIVPHFSLVKKISEDYGCKIDSYGTPIPTRSLTWHTGLYLTGALAELELGPPARNIIGAHLACRILAHIWEQWV